MGTGRIKKMTPHSKRTYFTWNKKTGKVEEATDLFKWAAEHESADRTVGRDIVKGTEEVTVSTVFLGINHSFGSGPPVLWETMIFGGEFNDYQERYHTYEEAVEGHRRAVALVKGESVT